MIGLILETSTERGCVAIVDSSRILFHARLPFGLQHARSLIPEIQRGLQQTSLALSNLSFIGVGIGPGSYTGIRMGVTVAKTLMFACKLPLVGICTLDAFVPDEEPQTFAVLIDAKIGGVYLKKGFFHQGRVDSILEPFICSIEDAVHILSDVDVLVTPNASQVKSKLEAISSGRCWNWEEKAPSPGQIFELASHKFLRKEFSLDGRLDLLYMRKTQAEIMREKEKDRSCS